MVLYAEWEIGEGIPEMQASENSSREEYPKLSSMICGTPSSAHQKEESDVIEQMDSI